jgi:hypothetical protein
MKKNLPLFIVAIVVINFIFWMGMVARLHYVCHNQCAHGDKYCQDRCFKKGFCPQEDR